ncbi:zinc finger protein ubi-d4-like isoform X2 [Acropora palmata]|uniref:zinc finger protein ubi-d4-like isoform X2 n=1 Tax=Acropora palmata TaxID=6131 RepID=UPI003DA12C40
MATRGAVFREPRDPQELYKDALESVSAFNSRLRLDRRLRIPFIDAQTGIAMNNCNLWISKLERRPGHTLHYVYSYPARRWRKKKRPPQAERTSEPKASDIDEQTTDNAETAEVEGVLEEPESDYTKEPVADEIKLGESEDEEDTRDDCGALSTDDEEFVIGKKRPISNKGRPRGKKIHHTGTFPEVHVPKTVPQIPGLLHVRNISKEELARMDPEERKKPYACEICGRRYKNGPGLKYHYTHYNHEQDASATHPEEPVVSHAPTPAVSIPIESPKVPSPPQQRGPGRPKKCSGADVSPNNYCDFCLGDVFENKKTGHPEELLSCADCGRSGHPTCLQFTGKLTESVKKYKWQCIECKSCTLCGTSDNDDQLLFCDDCDRGYHMYCLKPPMEKPPEGHWMCALCETAAISIPVPHPQMMLPMLKGDFSGRM